MRLLERKPNGDVILRDFTNTAAPAYAILSHTWGKEEVTFHDLEAGTGKNKTGWRKIQFSAKQAAMDGLQYIWIDTCCINKADYTELSECINSMFRFYQDAAKCYAYLSDVAISEHGSESSQQTWEPAFRNSRWFTRGWTLQELIAPKYVEFFAAQGQRLGDKSTLEKQIYDITGIPFQALRGTSLSHFTIDERMKWAEGRRTTRKEDTAYCLLGIFGVFIPLIYGEGDNAFIRLKEEINRSSERENTEQASKRKRVESPIPDVKKVKHPKSEATKNDVLEALRFEQIDDRFMNIKPGHADTCSWLLNSPKYLNWLDHSKLSQHHGFFWIKGKPGSGKSTITKFAFTEIEKNLPASTTILSFFFNARGSQLEKSTLGLYRSMLVQLLESSPYDHAVWETRSLSHRRFANQIKENCEMLKQLFAQTVQLLDQQSIIIVVDALDECDEDEVRDMIAFFEKLGENAVLKKRTALFHVLFSSRYYPHVTIQRCVEMKLEEQHGHSKDIQNYLLSELKIGRGEQADEIRQEIRDRALGVFMWTVLVVQILNKAFDHGQVHALRKKLQDIPDDLNELFRRILTRDSQNLHQTKLCLQWILYATRPLTREELYFAILSGIEPGPYLWQSGVSAKTMELYILSSSKGLAEITESSDDTVQFIHESVRDFLRKEDGLSQVWDDLSVNAVGSSHDRLKECCANYLKVDITTLSILTRVLRRPIGSSPYNCPPLSEHCLSTFPFLHYAILNVFCHADIAHAEGISQDIFVKEFNLDIWVRLYDTVESDSDLRYPPGTDLLYVLADLECPSLIDMLLRNEPHNCGYRGLHGNPVFAAIARGSHKAFEVLVNYDNQKYPNGCEFPYPSKRIPSFLIRYGTPSFVHRFLSIYTVDITSPPTLGATLLVWATEWGDEKLVELLLDKGAEINPQNLTRRNALQEASMLGQENIVQLLVDRGAEIDAQPVDCSPLYLASSSGHSKTVELLLDCGADIDADGGTYGSALQVASFEGREATIRLLLERGAHVDAHSALNGSALYLACSRASLSVVKLLLDYGADINAESGAYGGALQVASAKNRWYFVRLLLNRRAKVDAQVAQRGSALYHAASNCAPAMVKLLLDNGADINIQGGEFGNALLATSILGSESTIKILLERGADIDDQVREYLDPKWKTWKGIIRQHDDGFLFYQQGMTNPEVIYTLEDYQTQLMRIYQRNSKRESLKIEERDEKVALRSDGNENMVPESEGSVNGGEDSDETMSPDENLPSEAPVRDSGNHALQDYQMQLMLLEQQNKKRLLIAIQRAKIADEIDLILDQAEGITGKRAVGRDAG